MSYLLRTFILSMLMMSIVTVASAENTFQQGDQGNEVTEIQVQLMDLGYDVIADGEYGPATVDAIRQFQLTQGIEANGLVGPATYEALLGRDMPDISQNSNILARRIIGISQEYVGIRYVFGGNTPSSGFDCSGYVKYVFAKAGITLPRTADSQYYAGTHISTTDLRPGDLVFFSTYLPGPSHVGIYIGDGKFMHASSSRGVTVDTLSRSYWVSTYIGAARYF